MLVSAQELSDYMSGIRLNEAQMRSAEAVLAGVQSDLEDYLHRPVEPKRSRELVRVDRSGYVNVRNTPVTAVLRVQNYGSTLPAVPRNVVPNYTPATIPDLPVSDYAPINNGDNIIVPGGVKYGNPGDHVLIEYMAGGSKRIIDKLPQIKLAIMRVAAREVQFMHDDTMSLRNGNATPPADTIPQKGWTEDELRRFDRLRRRMVA